MALDQAAKPPAETLEKPLADAIKPSGNDSGKLSNLKRDGRLQQSNANRLGHPLTISAALKGYLGRTKGRAASQIARKAIKLAKTGDLRAMEFVRDTTEGKPSQQLKLTGSMDEPISILAARAEAIVMRLAGKVGESVDSDSEA